MNLQWTSPKLDSVDRRGVTRLDMPIMSYLSFKLSDLTGQKITLCFRLLTYAFSFTSIFFIVSFFWKRTRNKLLCLVILFFCYSSPILAYYQVTFIPSIPALSLSIVGILVFLNFLESQKKRHLILSVLSMTFGALIRFPHIIPLIAILTYFFFNFVQLKNKEKRLLSTCIPLTGLIIVFSYFLYNGYLEEEYGSMFLSSPRPVSSFDELLITFSKIGSYFYERFFSLSQLVIISICLGLLIYKRRTIFLGDIKAPFIYLFILFIGGCSYYLLMSAHIVVHDYYVFDSIYVPILLITLFLLEFSLHYLKKKYVYTVFLLFLVFQTLEIPKTKQSVITLFNYSKSIIHQNFSLSSSFIKSCKLPKDAM